MINVNQLLDKAAEFSSGEPFPHIVVDNFFEKDVARQLEAEFPSFDDSIWHEYGNALEEKKVCNSWNVFPPLTYRVFAYLNSFDFTNLLSRSLLEGTKLLPDFGLNGGGWHMHGRGGKLNTHLDYSLHPKLKLQRKINIIVYLNSNWQANWGGSLGLWGNESDVEPGSLVKEVEAHFNRAVIFDTTCNSWHGLPDPIECPENEYRKSLAIYYLVEPQKTASPRGKALFAPTEEQKDDEAILELIKRRSSVETASSVYSKKENG